MITVDSAKKILKGYLISKIYDFGETRWFGSGKNQNTLNTLKMYWQFCLCCCCQVTSVVSDSVWPHRRQPTRLPRAWDSPGKDVGMGCHFLLQCRKVKSESEVAQSCPILSDPMNCSLPGSSIHGIFQARVLEWGAIAFSKLKIRFI